MRDPVEKKIKPIGLPEVEKTAVIDAQKKADLMEYVREQLDPEAARNFKSTTMPFNEYEHTVLLAAVEKAGYKSTKQFMRDAYISKALHILEGKPYDNV